MKRFIIAGSCLTLLVCIFLTARAAKGQEGEWGTSLKGRIVWGGDTILEQKPIESIAKSNDKAHCLAKGDILDEEWVVNKKNKGLEWTFVWLAGKDPKALLPIHPDLKEIKKKDVVMDQPMCKFVPHALGMREGQVLIAKNSSPIPHNYKWAGDPFKGIGGNVLLPPGGSVPIKNLEASRLPIAINCNIHGWMKGWVRVYNHPYFAVTDKDGAFTIPKVPAGAYNLVVWHGSGGWRGGAKGKNGEPITIKANAVTDLGNLEYKAN